MMRPVEPVAQLLSQGIGGLRIAIAGGYFSEQHFPEAQEAVARVAKALGATTTVELPEAARARAAAYIITTTKGRISATTSRTAGSKSFGRWQASSCCEAHSGSSVVMYRLRHGRAQLRATRRWWSRRAPLPRARPPPALPGKCCSENIRRRSRS